MGNISVIRKRFNIFSNKPDSQIKVGTIKLDNTELNSEVDFISALQKAITNMDNGTYAIHHNNSLFARFDVKNRKIELHKRSLNTGILMPCWNYFKE